MAMSFERILRNYIKPIGLWQWLNFVVINLTVFGSHSGFPQLASLTPVHYCSMPILENIGLSEHEILNFTIPLRDSKENSHNGTRRYMECLQYKVDKKVIIDGRMNISNIHELVNRNETQYCQNGWHYEKTSSFFQNSFSQHFNLVCNRRYFLPLSSSTYFVGSIIGRIIGGFLCDKLGRKPVLIVSCIMTSLLGITLNWSPNILTFCILRFMIGTVSNISTLAGIVLWSEMTNVKHRNTFGFLFGVNESFLVPSFGIVCAYLLQDWGYLHMAISIMYGLAIFHPFVISESPQWLLSTNRTKEGLRVIKKAMRLNGQFSKFSPEQVEEMEREIQTYNEWNNSREFHEHSNRTWRDNEIITIFVQPYLRRRIIPFLFIWFVIMSSIHGMNYHSVRLEYSNPYIVAFVGCSFSLPVLGIKQILYQFFDRKRPLIAVFVAAGIVCLIGTVLRAAGIHGPWNAALATTVLGCALVAQNMSYALTAESFPTVYRSYAMGLVSGFGRAGSALSTFIERLDLYVWPGLPLLIFGILSLIGGLAVYIVPDTKLEEEEIFPHEKRDSEIPAMSSDEKKPLTVVAQDDQKQGSASEMESDTVQYDGC